MSHDPPTQTAEEQSITTHLSRAAGWVARTRRRGDRKHASPAPYYESNVDVQRTQLQFDQQHYYALGETVYNGGGSVVYSPCPARLPFTLHIRIV
jgi:hypothetical protein